MFVLRALLLTTLIWLVQAADNKIGYGGTFVQGHEGGLEGTVVVENSETLVIKDYVLADAGAPALYWWGSITDDLVSGFRISNEQVVEISDGGDLRIPLDTGKTPNDFSTVGLWCERFGVNFGQASLTADGDAASVKFTSDSASDSEVEGDAPSRTRPGAKKSNNIKPIFADEYLTARVYFFCVLGLFLLESLAHLPLYLSSHFNDGLPNSLPSRHSGLYLFFHMLFTLPSPMAKISNMAPIDLLRLTALIGLNILWGWNRNEYTSDFQLYGWLTLANGGLTLLMAARTNLFAIVARIPSTTLLFYHRWLGRITAIHASIHAIFLMISYVKSEQLANVVRTPRIQVGLMAWISLLLILITSLAFVRRRLFETFYYLHALFLLFVIGAFIHATRAAEFIVPGLALWGIDRLIRFTYNFRRIEVVAVTQHPGNLTKFRITGPRSHGPGQIAWIQIPAVSLINWHPFTIVSVPSSSSEAMVAIRGLGGYTKKVQSQAAEFGNKEMITVGSSSCLAPLKMRVDGPYGVGHLQWGRYPVIVIVAGGIGITPGITIACHIVDLARRMRGKVDVGQGWHVHILWVLKTAQYTTWFQEELAQLTAIAADPSIPMTFDLRIHVTGDKGSSLDVEKSNFEAGALTAEPGAHAMGPRSHIYSGRPDLKAYFQALRQQYLGLDAAVSACGPRSLIRSVRTAAVADQGHRDNRGAYYVEEEVFEF
ncbi:MAG: hypothetical protein M1825_004533 [Sarcosagium campestre]|nr:MAG: hypothetical protein M1825_004533 [Sarcosagium campestre]